MCDKGGIYGGSPQFDRTGAYTGVSRRNELEGIPACFHRVYRLAYSRGDLCCTGTIRV
jgi:hypothetical protein